MNKHFYAGIENLALNASQRQTLIQALEALGESNADSQPARRNHWRVRTDGDAVIFEALFNEDHWTIAAMKARLAAIFGVAVGTISHTVSNVAYGTVVTFIHSSVQRLRMIAFGGASATYAESQQAAQAYLAANAVAWGDV